MPVLMLCFQVGTGTYGYGAAIGHQQQHCQHRTHAVLPRGSLQETHGLWGQTMAGSRPPACLGSGFGSLLLLQSALLLNLLAGVHGLHELRLGSGAGWTRPVRSNRLGWRRGLAVPGGWSWAECVPLCCNGGRRVCLALRGSRWRLHTIGWRSPCRIKEYSCEPMVGLPAGQREQA